MPFTLLSHCVLATSNRAEQLASMVAHTVRLDQSEASCTNFNQLKASMVAHCVSFHQSEASKEANQPERDHAVVEQDTVQNKDGVTSSNNSENAAKSPEVDYPKTPEIRSAIETDKGHKVEDGEDGSLMEEETIKESDVEEEEVEAVLFTLSLGMFRGIESDTLLN